MDEDEALDILETIDLRPGRPAVEVIEAEAAAAPQGDGSPGAAVLWLAAAEEWCRLKDVEAARRCVQAAERSGGVRDDRLLLGSLGLALTEGDDAETARADRALRTLARADELSLDTVHETGELFEEHGRPKQALRWFTLPFLYVAPDDAASIHDLCLAGRYRVRTAMGMPTDRFDAVAAEIFPQLAGERRRLSAAGPPSS